MDATIIEADFQQYYGLELDLIFRQNFPRFCRLLLHLPFESRFIQKYSETKDWSWDKEVQSQILHALDVISCQLANMTKKEGRTPAKPQPQLQPDYVKKAKVDNQRRQRQKDAVSVDELNEMRQFWATYNNRAGEIRNDD